MKKSFLILSVLFLLLACGEKSNLNVIKVNNPAELSNAIAQAKAGDNIVLANGISAVVRSK